MAKKRASASLPQNLTQLNEYIASVGKLRREYEAHKASIEERVAEVRSQGNTRLAELAKKIHEEIGGIEAYANDHRDEILIGELKSVSFAAGRIGWRLPPWKVLFLKKGAEIALAYLKKRRMETYLRRTVEIDKEALLKDQPVVPGIKYSQKEEFFVEPNADPVSVEAVGEVMVVSR